ncbi:helix-turn-helix domain-containing protein [Chthonobacter rhizosphaerae]|uniref:helix-turn-helix domain-containing protein n=1 Tax=Chthonobacter rhizosphaerae TaxID=2735553 RepID=UPI0015EF8757
MAEIPVPYSRATFADASEQERGLTGWRQSYCQLKPGLYRGEVETLALDGVTIHRERINLAVQQRTAPPLGKAVYAKLLGDSDPWRVNAMAIDTESLTILRRPEEQTVAFADNSDLLILSVDEAAVGAPETGDPTASAAPAGEAFGFLASWVLSLMAHFSAVEGGVAGELATVLPGMIIDRVQFVHGKVVERTSPGRGVAANDVRLFRLARDVAEAEAGDGLTVADLAARTGVPPDVLRDAFMRTVGVGPGTWLRSRRLDGARRDLLEAGRTGARVTDIAAKWGFWHFGRFAASYAAYYGEPPSRTARRGGGA